VHWYNWAKDVLGFEGHMDSVRSVTFSHHGLRLVSGPAPVMSSP
jgi:hypothetical protein